MTNYIGNANEQNIKYSNAIKKIKELRSIYQKSINELDVKIKNVASVDKLKNSLTLKIEELDNIIRDIESTKSTIIWKANQLDLEEEKNESQDNSDD